MPSKMHVLSPARVDAVGAIVAKGLVLPWHRFWVRAEVIDGAGAIDIYVETPGGDIRHLSAPGELSRRLFDWVYSLPPRDDDRSNVWSVCIVRLLRDGTGAGELMCEDVADSAAVATRRSSFEQREFGVLTVAYDPL